MTEEFPHVRRDRALEPEGRARYGMDEAQHPGMKRLAVEPEPGKNRTQPRGRAPIDRVPQ